MRRNDVKRSAVLIPTLLLLSACGSQSGAGSDKQSAPTASGQVLPGTISDAMLPLDTVTSQSPPLKDTPAVKPQGPGAADSAAAAVDAAQPVVPEAAPVAQN